MVLDRAGYNKAKSAQLHVPRKPRIPILKTAAVAWSFSFPDIFSLFIVFHPICQFFVQPEKIFCQQITILKYKITHHCTFSSLLYTVSRVCPYSCIILSLIYKGCQFFRSLLQKTPWRVSAMRGLIFLSDVNCPILFAFLLEVFSSFLSRKLGYLLQMNH